MFPNIDASFPSEFKAVTTPSATLATNLAEGESYYFVSTTACWVAIGAAPTAAKANGSFYVPPNFPIKITCRDAVKKVVAVLQDAAGGNCTLTRCI